MSGREGPVVALDAMGGDHAPESAVAGALEAQREGVRVVLVGDEQRLRPPLEAIGQRDAPAIVHAPQAVGMDEDPALALRAKRDASIRVAARLVAAGQAGALVSAGSTGATLAAALLELGRLPGVRRPVVAAVLPIGETGVVLVDAGGTPDPPPEALPAYARMGIAYARVRGAGTPRVGLLNVGTEAGKGNALARAAYGGLDGTPGFSGNVEPAAVLSGAADVVVTDGFTGNVFLKTLEALASAGPAQRPGAAVLLGVAGEVLVAHGDSGPLEIAGALCTAADVARAKLSMRVGEQLAAGDLQGKTGSEP